MLKNGNLEQRERAGLKPGDKVRWSTRLRPDDQIGTVQLLQKLGDRVLYIHLVGGQLLCANDYVGRI